MEKTGSENWKLSTRSIHSGYNVKEHIRSASVSIYQTPFSFFTEIPEIIGQEKIIAGRCRSSSRYISLLL